VNRRQDVAAGLVVMSMSWSKRALLALLAMLTPIGAALPARAQAPENASLAGQFLIASPAIADPRFARTVILMVQHDRNGALGIIVNLPADERPMAKLLEMLGEKETNVAGTARIFSGGPVQPEIGFVVHSADYRRPETIAIDARVAMTTSREILRDIAHGKGPTKSLIAFGYAGWGPGQLEGELRRGSWFAAPAEPKLIFDEDRDKVWDLAFAQRTQDL
jgi:putative transcriptional regulator